MRTIFIIMDSLNRHYLRLLTATSSPSPPTSTGLRSAARVDFRQPPSPGRCPACRRGGEMLTGRVNFLETPWSPVQPWDECLPTMLREQRRRIQPHVHRPLPLLSTPAARATTPSTARGSSCAARRATPGARWCRSRQAGRRTRPGRPLPLGLLAQPDLGADGARRGTTPRPRCFERALDFIERNHDAQDWHLHLEVFDPHEPFDCPARYREQYGDRWDRYHFTWPLYGRLDPELDDEETVRHIRACYGGALTMADPLARQAARQAG